MEKPTECYGTMLEKYRELDEDEILSNLTQEELAQLEGEIDREVLNKIPEAIIEENSYAYSTTSNENSSSEDDDIRDEKVAPTATARQSYFAARKRSSLNRSLDKQPSLNGKQMQQQKTPLKFKKPLLRKGSSRETLRRQQSEEGELKKELMQAVNRRTKRRTSRANSSGISRRYKRRNSSSILRKQNSQIAKEDRKNAAAVNTNVVTQEMLSLRPKLKKVQTREPAKLHEMLHGVTLGHITSGAKSKTASDDKEQEEHIQPSDEEQNLLGDANISDSSDPPADDEITKANDNIYRRVQKHCTKVPSYVTHCLSDDVISSTTAGSTSAESYNVVGDLSINPNSVEDMILQVWEDDEDLIEVNLNNIQNVDTAVFEELASAMECNTHVKHLYLANVGLTDRAARTLASMLKRNQTLQTLNVESNFITGNAALRLVAALRRNTSLTELRIDNQRHIFGAKVEHEFSKILKDNKTLIRFGYQFVHPGPRMASSNCLTRNMDDVRKKRVAEQRCRSHMSHSNRPQLRKQASHDRYSKEQADKLKILQEQRVSLGLPEAVKDEHVQKVLNQMEPAQIAALEQWFINKLLENPQHDTIKIKDMQKKSKEHRKVKKELPRHCDSPRDQLLDSIRNQGGKTMTSRKAESSSRDSPRLTADLSDSGFGSKSPTIAGHETERLNTPILIPSSHQLNDALTNTTSSLNSSDDLIQWREGDYYDSEEYEVVEIDVTESDENESDVNNSAADKNVGMLTSIISEQLPHETTEMCVSDKSRDAYSPMLSTGDNSCLIYEDNILHENKLGEKRHNETKNNAIGSYDKLQIFDRCQSSSNLPDEESPSTGHFRRMMSCPNSPASFKSSYSLISTNPRPVKEDESWIKKKPHYKLGAK